MPSSPPKVAILVPRRADNGHRDRLWRHSRKVWAELFPSWPIVEGHDPGPGPFSRSAAVNRAAALAGSWDVCVIADSDVLPVGDAVREAVAVASTGRPASGFDRRRNLSRKGTERILEGYRGSWDRLVLDHHPLCISGAFALSRDLFEEMGGFDEIFEGWGFEDTAAHLAAETLAGAELYRVRADLWHLWHPRSPEHDPRLETFRANRDRRDLYVAARGDRPAMLELLEEARQAKRTPVDRALAQLDDPRRIPRILHRTVPEKPSAQAERFWDQWRAMLPGWVLLDHRDPLDPSAWPETGDLWPRCTSGAQLAGLIRLEALWTWGGIYVDSDVEPLRPLTSLLPLEGFAAWEDSRTVPDAVLGARRGHPAVALMLEEARARLLRGAGAWDTGPGVTTSTLVGRDDWTLLPPGSFYPYHYSEKHRRNEDHGKKHPYAFGVHHWEHSWEGK